MLEAADESVASKLEIVSALADQTFEFPMASTFEQLKDNYGEGMVQSVKRVVNILALPFSAQASIKVMSAQAEELTRRFKFTVFTVSGSERTSVSSVSHNGTMPKLSEDKVDSDDEEKDGKDGSDDEEEEKVRWSSFLWAEKTRHPPDKSGRGAPLFQRFDRLSESDLIVHVEKFRFCKT